MKQNHICPEGSVKIQAQSVVTMSKSMSNVSANAVIFSKLKHTDAQAVRGRSTLKDGNERTIRNGSFRELKIARESIDSAKVLPESNQKWHSLSIIRKCGQLVTKDDKRTFTNVLGADKDMMRYDQVAPSTCSKENNCLLIPYIILEEARVNAFNSFQKLSNHSARTYWEI